MPSTKLKNLAYRMMLPIRSPVPDRYPVTYISGHSLSDRSGLIRILKKHRVMGAALMFSSSEDELLVLTANKKTGQTAMENTYFRVASITKMATSMVALSLCDQGMLDLHAPVSLYLPEAESVKELEGVTLLHLLSHTSGLMDPPSLVHLLERGATYHEAVSGARFADPGVSFRYSNLAFGLIGCIMESVTGISLGSLFSQKLFGPLGMNATLEGCELPRDQIMTVIRLMPYRAGSGLKITKLGEIPLSAPDPLRHYGHTAGSMYTDIRSLFRLVACIRDGGTPVISSSAVNQMIHQHAVYGDISPTLSYGLGLLIIQDSHLSSGRILGHQGFAYGCADGAFWEENTGNIMIILNGGCSEARTGRLGLCNRDMIEWAFRKEIPTWNVSSL